VADRNIVAEQRLSVGSKLWYGVGQSAEGIKNAAFGTFLVLFYSQVLGLPAHLAGAATFLALTVDAVTDPVTGSLSDSLRGRWGRRHPFMYAAALPMALTFALVFAPPSGLGDGALFTWMLGFTVLARLSMTLYHVPHLALGADLSDDYHERTVVVAYRNFFGLLGAAALILICREYFLVPSDAYPNGELNPNAYPPMARFFGMAMGLLILASALGTHSRIPYLTRPATTPAPFSLGRVVRELGQALENHSFRNLFVGILIFYVARGVDTTLSIYMGTFFWRLDTQHVLLIPALALVGIAIGTPLWALLARRIDKKRIFIGGVTWFSAFTVALPVAKIAGFYPGPERFLYLALIYGFAFAGALGAAGALVASGSMLADIADEHELSNGSRQEGIFFGALSFSGKAAVGLSSALAGLALSLIAFPLQATPEQVPPEVVLRLGLVAGPGTFALVVAGIAFMARYSLTESRVAEIQALLHARRAGAS